MKSNKEMERQREIPYVMEPHENKDKNGGKEIKFLEEINPA